MSTLLRPRPTVRDRDAFSVAGASQERLFGDEPIGARRAAPSAAAPVREPEPPPPREEPRANARTLDAAIASLWQRLVAAEPATCPVCDGPMEPVRSTASGMAGGRCRSCGSTLA